MATFFISHSTEDKAAAVAVQEKLSAAGFGALFLDSDPRDGIPAGSRWERQLYSELRRADGVIFLGTPASVGSRWCFAELALARAVGKPIFPIVLKSGGEHPLLGDTQWIDFAREGDRAFERLWNALAGRGFDARDAFAYDPKRSPYPGLGTFEAADAAVFFGRDDEARRLVGRLQPTLERGTGRFVALIGPSGSGKSSLVRAGLIPRLRRDRERWVVVPAFTPGERPTSALAQALSAALGESGRVEDWRDLERRIRDDPSELVELVHDLAAAGTGQRRSVLLVVDQAEELTRVGREERAAFIALLTAGIEGSRRLWVVATLRSEFLDALLQDPAMVKLIGEPDVLGPLDSARIPEVVEGPAGRAGIDFDPGLVGRIAADTRGGDALPLLAYTLQQLYERAGPERRITQADYEAIGGVPGAVTSRADQISEELGRRGKGTLVVPTLLRFAAVDAAGSSAGRMVRRASLSEDEDEVVQAFVEARLLRSGEAGGEPVVQVAHDALLRVWRPLSESIAASAERLRLRSDLERQAQEWRSAKRSDSYLLRGERLAKARATLEAGPAPPGTALGDPEREFYDASVALEDSDQSRARRRDRRTRIGLVAALVLISVGAAVAAWQWVVASGERDQAQSRQLAASATLAEGRDPELALILADRAYRAAPTAQAEQALRQAANASRVRGALRDLGTTVADVRSLDGGRVLVAGGDGSLRVWDQATDRDGARAVRLGRWKGEAWGRVAVTPAGYVTGMSDGAIVLWQDGAPPRAIGNVGASVWDVTPIESGRAVLVAADSGVWRWDIAAERGRQLLSEPSYRVRPGEAPGVYYVSRSFASRSDPSIVRWQAGRSVPLPIDLDVNDLEVSPDGRLLAVATERGVHVLRTGPRPRQIYFRPLSAPGANDVAFADDGRRLAVAAWSGAFVFDARSGAQLAELQGHNGSVTAAGFAPGGRLVSGGDDGTAYSWDWGGGVEAHAADHREDEHRRGAVRRRRAGDGRRSERGLPYLGHDRRGDRRPAGGRRADRLRGGDPRPAGRRDRRRRLHARPDPRPRRGRADAARLVRRRARLGGRHRSRAVAGSRRRSATAVWSRRACGRRPSRGSSRGIHALQRSAWRSIRPAR